MGKISLVSSSFQCVPSSAFHCNFIHHNVWLCVENGILAFWLTYLGLWPVSLTTRLQWSLLIRDIAMQKLTVGLNWKSGACRLGTMGIHVFYSALNEHCTYQRGPQSGRERWVVTTSSGARAAGYTQAMAVKQYLHHQLCVETLFQCLPLEEKLIMSK